MASILIVDDEPRICDALTLLLRHQGHSTAAAKDGRTAQEMFLASEFDLVLLDVSLPDVTGIDLLPRFAAKRSDAVYVLITAHGSIRSAVDAIKLGAFDYLTKPFDNDDLVLTVHRALEHRNLGRRVVDLQQELAARTDFPQILGKSAAISELVRSLARVAVTDTTVLLQGESGTGKELAASSVHLRSRRAAGPFIAINCAAIPTTLAESELFGVERGAFTDARETRPGKFEQAHGGTLFLDEVAELPLEVQAKLLRVLQDRQITRLGSRRTIPVDVRVVAATNRDLEVAVKAGSFRDDLFWRLHQFPLVMPPLRKRLEDLPLLTAFLLQRIALESGTGRKTVSQEALNLLLSHEWPGNIRELENVLRYASIMSEGDVIDIGDLPKVTRNQTLFSSSADVPLTELVARSASRVEKAAIEGALLRHRGNRTEAAKTLGIGRRTLFEKLKRLRMIESEDGDDAFGDS